MPHDRRARLPATIVTHLVLGAVGIAAGFFVVDSGAASIAVVLGSLAYVAWTTGRLAGLAFAILAGSVQLGRADQPASTGVVVIVALWAVLYLAIVVVTSAIETATRPEE